MTLKEQTGEKVLSGLMMFSLTLLVMICYTSTYAQLDGSDDPSYYDVAPEKLDKFVGFGLALGAHKAVVKSDLAEINGIDVFQQGGTFIATTGNRLVRAQLRAGFYYASASMKRTVDFVGIGTTLNLYPLQFISKKEFRLNPFVGTGVTRSQQRFYGYYSPDQASKKVNYSSSEEPYLGNVTNINAGLRAGIEYHLPFAYDFVHFFAEVSKFAELDSKASSLFVNTMLVNRTTVNVGILFGTRR